MRQVHIDDLVDLLAIVLRKALAPETRSQRSSPYAKFMFAGSVRLSWREYADAVAAALHKHGAVPSPEAQSVTFEEALSIHPMGRYLGTNSLAIPSRARQLGWTPKRLNWRTDLEADAQRILPSMSK